MSGVSASTRPPYRRSPTKCRCNLRVQASSFAGFATMNALMLYLDTSLQVALLTNEAKTRQVQVWLGEQDPGDLVISDWVVAEFSAALSIKLRTGGIEADHRAKALA